MSLRRKRWNERVKLLATTFNVVALGIFGLGVVGPLFGPVGEGLVISFADRLYSVMWQAPASALIAHLAAHGTYWLLVDEGEGGAGEGRP